VFGPHTSKIDIQRSEPTDLDLNQAIKKAAKRNAAITQKVVIGDLLKKVPDNAERSRKRILSRWESDERLKHLKPFLDSWNKWREFYTGADNKWFPKNNGQLTAMENIIDMADKAGLHYDLIIACSFRAFEKRRFSLGLSNVLANGLEHYEKLIDDVLVDIEQHG
jgi:hypothetical protein